MNKNNGRTLYLECNSGISGDMTVAALLDLGADEKVLDAVLKSLPISGFETKVSRVKKAGLDVCDFHVILDKGHENHDHDMEYLHGHVHSHEAHIHGEHVHEGHDHEHNHGHSHEHRGLPEILHIIDHAGMTKRAKETAVRIFKILASAEAKAHGVPEDQVHFHEVGAVDSIVDIIAAAVCLDNLDIEECIIPVLCEGTGTVRCRHGVLPVPVPAVANIVADNKLNLSVMPIQGEFVTPTGAAVAAAIKTSDKLPERFTIRRIGMGGGKREYERPSILRAMLLEVPQEVPEKEEAVWKLESNIDDCTGEALGYVMNRLFEAGARDVHYTPVYMKKNRPACLLTVICDGEKVESLEEIIFKETTTIGIRRQKLLRSTLQRTQETVHTSLGEAQVKVCTLKSGVRKYPEYESVVELCKRHGLSYQEVYRTIERECYGTGKNA